MDSINRQISRARRLLWTQTILNIFAWCLIIAFTICFFGLLVPKIWFLPYTFASWSKVWLIGGGLAALLMAGTIALFYRPSVLYSAVEIDRRFGLRERISTEHQHFFQTINYPSRHPVRLLRCGSSLISRSK